MMRPGRASASSIPGIGAERRERRQRRSLKNELSEQIRLFAAFQQSANLNIQIRDEGKVGVMEEACVLPETPAIHEKTEGEDGLCSDVAHPIKENSVNSDINIKENGVNSDINSKENGELSLVNGNSNISLPLEKCAATETQQNGNTNVVVEKNDNESENDVKETKAEDEKKMETEKETVSGDVAEEAVTEHVKIHEVGEVSSTTTSNEITEKPISDEEDLTSEVGCESLVSDDQAVDEETVAALMDIDLVNIKIVDENQVDAEKLHNDSDQTDEKLAEDALLNDIALDDVEIDKAMEDKLLESDSETNEKENMSIEDVADGKTTGSEKRVVTDTMEVDPPTDSNQENSEDSSLEQRDEDIDKKIEEENIEKKDYIIEAETTTDADENLPKKVDSTAEEENISVADEKELNANIENDSPKKEEEESKDMEEVKEVDNHGKRKQEVELVDLPVKRPRTEASLKKSSVRRNSTKQALVSTESEDEDDPGEDEMASTSDFDVVIVEDSDKPSDSLEATVNSTPVTPNNKTDKSLNDSIRKLTFPVMAKFRRGDLKNFSSADIEELIVQKVCEAIAERSEMGILQKRAQKLQLEVDKYKERWTSINKQLRDLEAVFKNYMKDVKINANNFAFPARVTRSVGLQVHLTPEKLAAEENARTNRQNNRSRVNSPASSSSKSVKSNERPARRNSTCKILPKPSIIQPVNVVAVRVAGSGPSPIRTPTTSALMQPPVTPITIRTPTSPAVKLPLSPVKNVILKRKGNVATKSTTKPPAAPISKLKPATTSLIDLTDEDVSSPSPSTSPAGGNSTRLKAGLTSPKKIIIHRAKYIPPGVVPGRIIPVNAISHPAPLPETPPTASQLSGKLIPPKPTVSISNVASGIILSWDMALTDEHERIATYQLMAYSQGDAVPSPSLWRKVGDIKAIPLPMACTLTSFVPGNKYHFAVRAVDIKNRYGPFSAPSTIALTDTAI